MTLSVSERARPRPPLLIVALDPDLAAHLAVAAAGYRRALRAARQPEPAGLADVADALGESARKRQRVHALAGAGHGDGVPEFLTVTEAAEVLRVSTRTVHRHVATGALASVVVGRRRLVPVDALCTMAAA